MTRLRAFSWSALAWIAVWAFWLVTTWGYHANWLLAVIATTALVGSYATAAYINQLEFVPKYLRTGRYGLYAMWLIVVLTGLTAAALAVIRLFYVKVVGPFPVKPWYIDYGIDLAGMAAHVLAAALVVWLFGRVIQASHKM